MLMIFSVLFMVELLWCYVYVHLTYGVIGAIKIISIDEENWLGITLELKIISHKIICKSM